MIICGSRWDAKDNASYGFVYSSADGGNLWRTAMEDKNTVWVTEHSCSFGVHGMAYFVSDASKIIDGEDHHDLGTTRIYVSHDSGKSWKLGITTGWTDYSTSVVDTTPGPNQNRLYVFFNSLYDFYNSVGNKDVAARERQNDGTRVGLISYKDGDTEVVGPFTSAEMAKEGYQGSYPAPSFLLNNGLILAFFTAHRRTDKGVGQFLVEAVLTTSDRAGIEVVKIVDSLENPEYGSGVPCAGYGLTTGGAYDAAHDKLYFAYPDVREKKCGLWLTTSTDGGKSWSNANQLWAQDDARERVYAAPSIAVNKDGVLAAMWQEKYRSGCWMFAVSTDAGKSLSRSRQLGTCSAESSKPSLLTSPYLWTSFSQADPKEKSAAANINLRNTRGSTWRNERAIAVTPDGAFHPVWIDAGNGEGGIRTVSIRVMPEATMIAAATQGLEEVTDKVAVLYGGSQFYDSKTGMLTLDVTLKNNSDKTFHEPFKLAVPSFSANYGMAEIADAENNAQGAGAVWDLSRSVSGGVLAPGTASKPFSLQFHYVADPGLARDSDDIFGLSVKVYAKP
jgi:hypothetical protein